MYYTSITEIKGFRFKSLAGPAPNPQPPLGRSQIEKFLTGKSIKK
jgi:hypothetical protein